MWEKENVIRRTYLYVDRFLDHSECTERDTTITADQSSLSHPSISTASLVEGTFELQLGRREAFTLPKIAIHIRIPRCHAIQWSSSGFFHSKPGMENRGLYGRQVLGHTQHVSWPKKSLDKCYNPSGIKPNFVIKSSCSWFVVGENPKCQSTNNPRRHDNHTYQEYLSSFILNSIGIIIRS